MIFIDMNVIVILTSLVGAHTGYVHAGVLQGSCVRSRVPLHATQASD